METNSEDRLLDYIDELESAKCKLVDNNDRLRRDIMRLKSVIVSKNVLIVCMSIVILLLLIFK